MKYLYDSPLGKLLLMSDGECLTSLVFSDKENLQNDECEVFDRTIRYLEQYFSGQRPDVELKIRLRGTEFQEKVWAELQKIPYGKTISYGEIAARIHSRAYQAVGQAVGHNPVAIIVPCHRVIKADGAISGYAWGVERKKELLKIEGWLD